MNLKTACLLFLVIFAAVMAALAVAGLVVKSQVGDTPAARLAGLLTSFKGGG